MPLELSLRQEDARLVYLAVAYHLGRPGSELDPLSKQPVEHGLGEVARALQPQLRLAVATISLNPDQASRLQSAMLGTISELKTYPMLQPRPSPDGAERRSSVPGFDGTLLHLFPEVESEAEACLEIAERMLMLKRRLDPELAAIPQVPMPAPVKRKGLWPFRR